MHPLWQLKQVITFEGEHRVDRCNIIGNQKGGDLWCAFMSLVLWIAIFVRGISDLLAYVDDAFLWEFEDNIAWYAPYSKFLPQKQSDLLELWDELGIPHDCAKQIYGTPLLIIGFEVDAKLMKSLNVFPLLRPGLSLLYDKISNKLHPHQLVELSVGLSRELEWLASHIKRDDRTFFLDSVAWGVDDADIIIYGDASLLGLEKVRNRIFFYEALTVVCALQWATTLIPRPSRIIIFSDNSNTVDLFDTLRAKPVYNSLLRFTIDLLIHTGVDLRVLHIPGEMNSVADALSRGDHQRAIHLSSKQPHRLPWTTERLQRERAIAIGFSLERSSRLSYTSALNSYISFCHLHNFPLDPNPDTLSFFVVYMCHHIRPQSVESYLSGICNQLEPFFPHVCTAHKSPLVTRTLKGCKKQFNSPPSRKRPLSRSDLTMLLSSYSSSKNHDDLLFLALITTGFHALMRLGELVWPDNAALRDWRKVTLRSTVHILPHGFEFFLPYQKTDKFYEGDRIIVPMLRSPDDPVLPFIRYLQSRDHLHPVLPHLWTRLDGSIPTRSWFIHRLRQHFPNDVAGHSLHSGGATALAEDGVTPEFIQRAGRWSSDAFERYIRKHPFLLIALLFNTRLPTSHSH
ncbi:hypothetical protein EW146_g6528 [Bondarzewia mesenterica]|uniref:Tyr recombinase domain-containing protein n=1 Tax=Bondarzewia mesenterica TaxID=1095465 RepID=A0A4V3XEH8_9AGAM|nr:hypothetical protein EW146_g6528 [Bondarzewia mesenterica]